MCRPKPITPARRKVLAAIKKLQRKGVHAGLGMLALELGCTKTNVAEALDRLARDGWIERAEHVPGVGRRVEVR